MVTTAAAGADLIEAVPGDPARVREVAASWLETSHAVGEALESTAIATRATPSWEGLSARAFTARGRRRLGPRSGGRAHAVRCGRAERLCRIPPAGAGGGGGAAGSDPVPAGGRGRRGPAGGGDASARPRRCDDATSCRRARRGGPVPRGIRGGRRGFEQHRK